jgi:hypothetical protein
VLRLDHCFCLYVLRSPRLLTLANTTAQAVGKAGFLVEECIAYGKVCRLPAYGKASSAFAPHDSHGRSREWHQSLDTNYVAGRANLAAGI